MSDNEIPVVAGFRTSSTIGELTKALALAHKDFKPVLKDASNPFFKSKYADLAGVIEATSDALSARELVVIQSPGRIVSGHILLTTLLSHSSGEWVKDELELPIAKFDAQGTGSAITYARRYAYQAIVGVAAEDDDGNSASGKFEKQPDGNFVRKTDIPATNGQNAPSVPQLPVIVKLPEPAKPVARKKKESVPDAGKPWGGEFDVHNESTPGTVATFIPTVSVPEVGANIHGLVIEDSEIPFPGDDEKPAPTPEPVVQKTDRLATAEERKGFMDRLIKLKNAGYTGIREWLLKESGQTITNDIPFVQMESLVTTLETAEKNGTLKTLLEGK